MQLAAGQHRFKEVARVHRAFGLAGAHDEVELVDEQQDAAVALFDLGKHRLEALLELPAVFRAGHQRAHVEREDRLVLQPLGHVAAQNALGEALDNGGLANAGFADQDGIVLGLAGEDPDGAADLLVATDDRVHPALARLRDQVDSVLLQRLVGAFGIVRGHLLAAADLAEGLEDLRPVQSEALEQLL